MVDRMLILLVWK